MLGRRKSYGMLNALGPEHHEAMSTCKDGLQT